MVGVQNNTPIKRNCLLLDMLLKALHFLFIAYLANLAVTSASLLSTHANAPRPRMLPHDCVSTLALGFVTLTPSCFALATISMRFLDPT